MGAPIVLLTDFGLSDPYVGQMKGVLLGIAPDALIGSSGRLEVAVNGGSAADTLMLGVGAAVRVLACEAAAPKEARP